MRLLAEESPGSGCSNILPTRQFLRSMPLRNTQKLTHCVWARPAGGAVDDPRCLSYWTNDTIVARVCLCLMQSDVEDPDLSFRDQPPWAAPTGIVIFPPPEQNRKDHCH